MDTRRGERTLAALLHGIDDLLPAADVSAVQRSPDGRRLLEIARAFHQPAAVAPRWASAAHRCAGALTVGPHLTRPLEAITSHVRILDGRPDPAIAYLQVGPMPDPGGTIEDLCPIPDAALAAASVTAGRTALGAALGAVVRGYRPEDLDAAIARALEALRAYGWALPAHDGDCALYEHARLCAAAAACLPDEPGDRPLLLVHGDLSGIQTFIFGTAQAAGGPARRLRARSAALLLMMETVGHRLLHACAAPLPNLLAATAGHLYLLLPADKATVAHLVAARRAVSRWLHDTYTGELALHLAWQEVAPDDLLPQGPGRRGCGPLMRDLAASIGDSKARPLIDALQRDEGAWDEEAFMLAAPSGGDGICAACQRRPARHLAGAARVCDLCGADYRLGGVLPTTRALAFYRDDTLHARATSASPPPGLVALLPPYSVQALRPGDRPAGAPYLVAPFDALAAGAFDAARVPVLRRHVITRVPRDHDGAPLDFDALAREAQRPTPAGGRRGAPYLGYLRADIDRLGTIFADGLRRDQGGHDGLAQILMLSRTLDAFMNGWLQHLLLTQFPFVYPVFGGGDDLVLIGPWDAILRIADRVRADFARYTANPQMSLSAGVAIVRPDLPVPRAAEVAGAAEDLAKDGGAERTGRDSIAAFGAALGWEELRAIEPAVARLTGDAGVGGAFLHRLLSYGGDQRRYRRGDLNALRYKMRLAYDVGRNIRANKAVSSAVRDWCTELVEANITDRPDRADLRYIDVVARWAILATRGEE